MPNTLDTAKIDWPTYAGTLVEAGAFNPLPVTLGGPLVHATPEVGGSAQSMVQLGDGTNDIFYLRCTLNAGSDLIAGARLKAGYPDTYLLVPGESYSLHAGAAITRLDLLAVGDTESGTPSSGEIATEASTETTIRSLMVTWTFASADAVRTALLQLSERYSAGTAGVPVATAHYVRALLGGRKHA